MREIVVLVFLLGLITGTLFGVLFSQYRKRK